MKTASSPAKNASQVALAILQRHGDTTNNYLRSLRNRYGDAPSRLLEAIDYSLLAGGKRLRPALVLECASAVAHAAQQAGAATEAIGDRPDKRRRSNNGSAETAVFPVSAEPVAGAVSALAAAGAIELIHTFSLVHDDLPAMDDDDLRRGVPTNHKVFGEAMAVLAGDAMVTVAFEMLAIDADPRLVPRLVRELASASGPEGMIGGQVLDMDGESRSLPLADLQRVHRLKTGALLTCACRMGAIAAGAAEAEPGNLGSVSQTTASSPLLSAATEYGRHLGLAFQIVDDVLDVTSTPEQLGKATNKDADRGKNTYPSLLGLEASKREAVAQLDDAIDALKPLGASADGLRTLARFVVERNV